MQESINKLISEIFSQSTKGPYRTNGYVRERGTIDGLDGFEMDAEKDRYSSESTDLLYAYIEAELDELNAELMFPEIHTQLASNSALQESYGELRDLLVMERENRLVEPPFTPSFDFSYLEQQVTPDILLEKSWRLNEIGQLIIEFTSELLQSIRPLNLQSSMVKSIPDDSGDKMYHYMLKNHVEDLRVEIGVKSDRVNPSQCHVAALIAIPSLDGWPNWKNSQVMMKLGHEILQSQATDAFGRVLFEPIDLAMLPHLNFEVTPATLMH